MSPQPPRPPDDGRPNDNDRDVYDVITRERLDERLRKWAVRKYGPEGEDFAQEAMVRIAKRRTAIDLNRDIWPYLKTVTIHVASDVRGKRAALSAGELDESVPDPSPRPDERVLERERCHYVMLVWRRLAPRDQFVLNARHVDGISTSELAELLGVSQNAARQALARACLAFRREWRRMDGPELATVPVASEGIAVVSAARPLASFFRRIGDRLSEFVHRIVDLVTHGDPTTAGAAAAVALALLAPNNPAGNGRDGGLSSRPLVPPVSADAGGQAGGGSAGGGTTLAGVAPVAPDARMFKPPTPPRWGDRGPEVPPRLPPLEPPTSCRVLVNSESQIPCDVRDQLDELTRPEDAAASQSPDAALPSQPPRAPGGRAVELPTDPIG